MLELLGKRRRKPRIDPWHARIVRSAGAALRRREAELERLVALPERPQITLVDNA
jgi:hypothetical protein